ncbi:MULTISPECIES: hypothetical protein [unclassified Pseudomonas]|uniref:hypothetical protein n=1 Tax=unclassified Pseudomonas TaxID=196821 RepID=UPI002B232F1C|nr:MULTISPECIES: hypothetical protein [unclassified Pseudomonas]MEA9975715.1 hypothetical protein [Pseudomonas sp. RTS4]MEB0197504.1 hypothetical protein [Pseudomonas sp. 5S4]MEB0245009.1 hypothetical protein [Pseudomonas sp. 10S5]
MAIGVISSSIPVNVGVTAEHQAKFRVTTHSASSPSDHAVASDLKSIAGAAADTEKEGGPDDLRAQAINVKV